MRLLRFLRRGKNQKRIRVMFPNDERLRTHRKLALFHSAHLRRDAVLPENAGMARVRADC
jgi:hypothetical protein